MDCQRFQEIVELLPLDELEPEEQDQVKNYLQQREKWAEIAYDVERSSDEKVTVYEKLRQMHDKVYPLLDELFKQIYQTEQMAEYDKLRSALREITTGYSSLVGTTKMSVGERQYQVYVPEGPFFDPEEGE